MIIITLTYTADLAEVDRHVEAHVAWLKAAIADGWILVAGRRVPRIGGILIARGSLEDIAARAAQDPFVIAGVAEFTLAEFIPSLLAPGLDPFNP